MSLAVCSPNVEPSAFLAISFVHFDLLFDFVENHSQLSLIVYIISRRATDVNSTLVLFSLALVFYVIKRAERVMVIIQRLNFDIALCMIA